MGAVIFYKKNSSFEVRVMVQNFLVFYIIERIISSIMLMLPPSEKIASFLIKHRENFLLTVYTNFIFYLKYLRFLSLESRKTGK